MERIIVSSTKVILAGYFDIHFDLQSDTQTALFMDVLATFDLHQHITDPTHRSGHTLDLLITKGSDSDCIISRKVYADAPSDHSYIVCDVCFPRPKRSKVEVNTRKISCINIESFIDSLENCIFELDVKPADESVDVLVIDITPTYGMFSICMPLCVIEQ